MTLTLRYMHPRDIGQVVEIDQAAFPTPWSPRSYAFEVQESAYSHMVVLEDNTPPATGGLLQVMRRVLSRGAVNGSAVNGMTAHGGRVLAYGGLWRIADEAHISTIASRLEVRGQGYGEVILAAMIRRAITLGATYMVLEVRVSNVVAQNLYRKYEFRVVDTKRGYYHDNHEDAFDMRLNLVDPALLERFNTRYAALRLRHDFVDRYTQGARPFP